MKGILFSGDRKLKIEDLPRPKPGEGEVLIEMKASGICGSDLMLYRKPSGEFPEQKRSVVMGHEPCGVVAELGPSSRNLKVGDRVIIHHHLGCGNCTYCQSGWPQHCIHGPTIYGWTLNGGHEDYMVCADRVCIPLPDELTFEEGASCACCTGTAFQALKRLAPSGRDTLVVFGQGPVGLSVNILAKAMGSRVIAIDTITERLELGKRLGADEVVNTGTADPVTAVRELTGGEGADVAVDCTGVEIARINTLKSARIWGRVCFLGEHGTATFEMTPQIIHKQLTIYGSWTFGRQVLTELTDFIVKRKVPLKDTITDRFPLAQAEEAYKLFDKGKTGKVVFVW